MLRLIRLNDPQILSNEQRSALLEVSSALKFIRVWGSSDILVTKEAEVPKRLAESKPDAVYRSKMSEMTNFLEKEYEWVPVEVRRYGRLLLGFKILGNGETAEKYAYWGYDKAGSKASQVDEFYGAVQSESLQDVRRLSRELEKSASMDRDMYCGWYGLETRVGDPVIAKLVSANADARQRRPRTRMCSRTKMRLFGKAFGPPAATNSTPSGVIGSGP